MNKRRFLSLLICLALVAGVVATSHAAIGDKWNIPKGWRMTSAGVLTPTSDNASATPFDLGGAGVTGIGELAVDSLIADGTALVIGAGTETITINSSDWDISTTGVMTGIGAITADGILSVTNTTGSTTPITGAVVIAGGLGIGEKTYCGDDLVLAYGADLYMSTAATREYGFYLKDGQADALSIIRGSTDMMVFNSSTPSITITPATTITGLLTAAGGIDTVGATTDIALKNDATIVNTNSSLLTITEAVVAFSDAATVGTTLGVSGLSSLSGGLTVVGTLILPGGSIEKAFLGANSVGRTQLESWAVYGDEIASKVIIQRHIADDAILSANIAVNQVLTANIGYKTILAEDIADGAVTVDKLQNLGVTTPKIATSAITNEKLATGAVTGSKITAATITAAHLAWGAVGEEEIGNKVIIQRHIADNAILSANIAANQIKTVNIGYHEVTADKIDNGSVNCDKTVGATGTYTTVNVVNGIVASGS